MDHMELGSDLELRGIFQPNPAFLGQEISNLI